MASSSSSSDKGSTNKATITELNNGSTGHIVATDTTITGHIVETSKSSSASTSQKSTYTGWVIKSIPSPTSTTNTKFVTQVGVTLWSQPYYNTDKLINKSGDYWIPKTPPTASILLGGVPADTVLDPVNLKMVYTMYYMKNGELTTKKDQAVWLWVTYKPEKSSKKIQGWIPKDLPTWEDGSRVVSYSTYVADSGKSATKETDIGEASDNDTSEAKPSDSATIDRDREQLRAQSINMFLKRMQKLVTPPENTENPDDTFRPDNLIAAETDDSISYNVYNENDATDYKYANRLLRHAVRSRTILYEDRDNWRDKYNRMQFANPYQVLGPTREYLFFVKPDLHIMGKGTDSEFIKREALNPEIASDVFWIEMKQRYPDLIRDLQLSSRRSGNTHDAAEFIRILTNAVSGTLDLPDVSAETVDTPQNIYGTSLQYKKSGMRSDEGFDFSLEFRDSPQLEVYHFFKMWSEYSNLKDLGMVTPPGKINCNAYRINKILHDQIGIFKFIVDEDMETIIYYAYLTGCFPKSVPRATFGNLNPGNITYSIDWHAQFVEDSNPLILLHFNMLMRRELSRVVSGADTVTVASNYSKSLSTILNDASLSYIPIYSIDYQEINGGWRQYPIISKIKDKSVPGNYRYLLQWYDKA